VTNQPGLVRCDILSEIKKEILSLEKISKAEKTALVTSLDSLLKLYSCLPPSQ